MDMETFKINMNSFRDESNIKTALVFGASFLGVYYLYKKATQRDIKEPPGPFAFPIIGNMPQLAGSTDPYKIFLKMREKYGDVFRVSVGSMKLVVVCGYKAIHEGLIENGHNVANRPNWLYLVDKIFHGSGVIWSNGKKWKDLRRFTLVTLRDLGVGKKTLEERIQDEFLIMLDVVNAHNAKPFNPKHVFAKGVSNIICTIVFGERFDYDDPEFNHMLDMLNFLFKNAGVQVPENFFPFLAHVRSDKPMQQMITNDVEMQNFVLKKIQEHRSSFDPDQLRDFIDLFLKVSSDTTDSFLVSEKDVFRVIVDLFLAGSETTATSMWWVTLYWICFPEVQEKCYQEIKKATDNSRMVNLADKPSLVYNFAFLNEVLRVVCIAPVTPPRAVSEEFKLKGFTLEKDTIVMFHIYSAHYDKDFWEEPEKFNPDRWIGPDGKIRIHKAFMPFGGGARSCMGESLANMELFLFACNFIQRFKFSIPAGKERPSLDGIQTGVTVQPQPYEVVAIPR